MIPKEEKFFDLFDELANKIEEGGELFLDMVEHYEYSEPKIVKLKELEHEADVITHKTYEKMHKTFLTPLDREDIYALVNKMDSILDMIEASAARMSLYKVKIPAKEIIEQAKILNKSIKTVKYIVHAMRNMKNAKMIIDACVEINSLENEGDNILKNAIAKLFNDKMDPLDVIKWKEIYENLESAIDMCESVANTIVAIIAKNA